MGGQEGRQTPDRKGELERRMGGRGAKCAASPNEQQIGGGGPKWRTALENGGGKLIGRNRQQCESESQQKKSGSSKALRSKISLSKRIHVWCVRRRHYRCRTSDDTLTEFSHTESRELSRVPAAKQEVAGHANQGGRANPYSSHLVGPNVVLFGAGRSAKWG